MINICFKKGSLNNDLLERGYGDFNLKAYNEDEKAFCYILFNNYKAFEVDLLPQDPEGSRRWHIYEK